MDTPLRRPTAKRQRWMVFGIASLVITATAVQALVRQRDPAVALNSLQIDTVRRGIFSRTVRASGALVPESMQFIVAVTSGRIDALPLRPGAPVEPSTVIAVLSNPDVQLEALGAARALTDARSALLALESSLRSQRLTQMSVITQLTTQHANAARDSVTFSSLAARRLVSPNEATRVVEAANDLNVRLQLEQDRLAEQDRAASGQRALAREGISRMEAIDAFQQRRVSSMHVAAGAAGQLLSLGSAAQPLERGQWVLAGQTLASVAQSGRLKAVLRVPETQARDLANGQAVSVDTRNGLVSGRVTRVDPSSVNSTVQIEVTLSDSLPRGARADLAVDATIELDRRSGVISMRRPPGALERGAAQLFRLDRNDVAIKTQIRFGRASFDRIEVTSGLSSGDRVITSDMSAWLNQSTLKLLH